MVARQDGRYNRGMTIKLDNLPANVTEALTKQAKLEGKSLQDVVTEAIVRGVAATALPIAAAVGTMFALTAATETVIQRVRTRKKRDLSRYRGKWIEDPAVDAALKSFDEVDEEMWR